MNKASFLVVGSVLMVGASLFAGAGCGGNSGMGGAGGESASSSSASSSTSTSGSSASSSSSSSASSSSSGGMPMLTCDYYCSTIMTGCNDKMKTQQYADMASCLATCAGFFKTGALSDTMGDTLGCRIYHAGVASKDAMSALTHCGHAGPTGGDKDVSDAAGGPCGEGCESFCAIQAKVCTGANQVYADIPTCMAACKMAPADVADYSIADTATNDFGCRMYHLTAAASAPALHCAHITGAKGTPCNP